MRFSDLLRTHNLASVSVGVLLCLQLLFTSLVKEGGGSGLDFAHYYVGNKLLTQGLNIYHLSDEERYTLWKRYVSVEAAPPAEVAGRPFIYPPLLYASLSPLATIPWRTALTVFRCLSIVALIAATSALSLLLRGRWVDPIVFGAMTLWVPTYATLYNGQVNDFILLTVVLFLLLVQRQRNYAAGLVLSAGLMLKPIAAPLIVYLSYRRDLAKLLPVLLGLALMSGITVLLAGAGSFLDYLEYGTTRTAPSPLGTLITYPPNQAFFGFFGRALTLHAYGHSIANEPQVAHILSFLAIGVVLLVVAFLTWPQGGLDTFALEIGLVLAAIPLVEPFGEYHHATLVIVPFLLTFCATDSVVRKAILAVALVLLDVQGLFWHHLVGMTFLLSLGTYGLLLIFSITAMSLHAQRKNCSSSSTTKLTHPG